MSVVTLASAATANGNYPSAAGIKPTLRDLCVIAQGTFGGATVTLEASVDDVVWVAIASGTFTAAGTLRLQLGETMSLRAVITSASGSTSITVKAS